MPLMRMITCALAVHYAHNCDQKKIKNDNRAVNDTMREGIQNGQYDENKFQPFLPAITPTLSPHAPHHPRTTPDEKLSAKTRQDKHNSMRSLQVQGW